MTDASDTFTLPSVKLLLRLENTVPLFMVFLILNTAWKLGWQHLASRSSSKATQALAGAAAFQSP